MLGNHLEGEDANVNSIQDLCVENVILRKL